MNIILNILNWFSQNILQNQPSCRSGSHWLCVIEKPAHDVYAGFIKATAGLYAAERWGWRFGTTFRPILAALNFKFKIGAAVIDPYCTD